MGTKDKPGKYDCYLRAEPDEPLFVLRAKDPAAPAAVRAWIAERQKRVDKPGEAERLAEAETCALAMETWRGEKINRLIS